MNVSFSKIFCMVLFMYARCSGCFHYMFEFQIYDFPYFRVCGSVFDLEPHMHFILNNCMQSFYLSPSQTGKYINKRERNVRFLSLLGWTDCIRYYHHCMSKSCQMLSWQFKELDGRFSRGHQPEIRGQFNTLLYNETGSVQF